MTVEHLSAVEAGELTQSPKLEKILRSDLLYLIGRFDDPGEILFSNPDWGSLDFWEVSVKFIH